MQLMDKLKNLLVMAAADGSLTQREIQYLSDRCKNWGLSDAALVEAINYALSKQAELTIPPRKPDRLEMLRDLMSMMAADGDLSETEKHLFAVAAAQMEIDQPELENLIDAMTKRQGS